MTSLGDALPREMARVRDDVLPIYLETPNGHLAAACMRHALDQAAMALATGDTIAMIRILEELKGYQL